MSLLTQKLITLFSMAAVTFFTGLLPLFIFSKLRNNTDVSSKMRWRLVISLSSCFSGGVFIAALFLDLLPDVEESFESVNVEIKEQFNVDIDFPLAEIAMVFGFLLILTIEQTVLHFQEKWAQQTERQPLISDNRRTSYQDHPSSYPHHDHAHDDYETDHDFHEDDHQDHHNHVTPIHHNSSLRSILLLLALSFHSIFDGLAIGLQDEANRMISIFIAVLVHKAVMAFSLGLNIAQSSLSFKSFMISNIIFTISSPIGMGIGMGILGLPHSLTQDIISSVLQAIAGGTFLYITFFEVLPHELNQSGLKHRLWKVLFTILGFLCMFGVISVS